MSDEMLTTQQAASRLGVKPETLYAYVSRGLIGRTRAAGSKGSLFSAAEVEALAERTGRGTAEKAGPGIRTALTLVEDDRLYYRGREVAGLARSWSFETAAEWLWAGQEVPDARFAAPEETLAAARAAAAALPERALLPDRLRAAVTGAAVADPLRFDIQPARVLATTRALIAAMTTALPRLDDATDGPQDSIAELLWPRLTRRPPTEAGLYALNGALVLLADHDIAASTYAARIAAATRAHPYSVVAAGLAVLDGPLHGGAGALARKLISAARASGDPVGTLGEWLREGGPLPGFGNLLYQRREPRGETLLELVARIPDPEGVRPSADALIEVARERLGTFLNSDFALATLALVCGMVPGAEEAVFAIARTAGWIAHALEEYQAPAVRHRPHGSYTGPRPAAG